MRRSLRVVPVLITLTASVAVLLAMPAVSCATPILYSITGTATDFRRGESYPVLAVTGRAVISDQPHSSSSSPPFDTDSMLRYDVEDFLVDVEGVGLEQGSGFLHLEAEGPTWAELGDLAGSFGIGFFRQNGAPYPPGAGNQYEDFAAYFSLAPIITLQTRDSAADEWNAIFFDLTLTRVPEPSALLNIGIGLAGVLGAALRGQRRSRRHARLP